MRNRKLEVATIEGGMSLWEADGDKYKCCCRSVHITRAALYIGYAQMLITFIFAVFFAYYYVQAVNGSLSTEHWINQLSEKYISSLLLAISLQLLLVTLLIHGVRSERPGFLMPFIVFAGIAILFGMLQLCADFTSLIKHGNEYTFSPDNQLVSHVLGTLVHLWCLSIVWRCYQFFNDKKVAIQISEQLAATHAAFQYNPNDMLPYGYVQMQEPPPYADTVISDKAPLTGGMMA